MSMNIQTGSMNKLDDPQIRAFVEGMELAMRICRNRCVDCEANSKSVKNGNWKIGQELWRQRSDEADMCAEVIRIVQVQIGAGQMPMPTFTVAELDEINRIR